MNYGKLTLYAVLFLRGDCSANRFLQEIIFYLKELNFFFQLGFSIEKNSAEKRSQMIVMQRLLYIFESMQGAIFSFIKEVLGFFKPEAKSRAGVSHYSYDVHGNVKTLVQEIGNKTLVKRIDYDFDLLSGKINLFTYQAGQTDQLIHRYSYDSDNRLTQVETSTDGVIWATDAKYQFYAHGMLARTTIGDNAVETQNNIYTLQGWIKAIDGQHFKYALGYNSTDFTSIGTNSNLPTNIATGKDLYNGNIATWASQSCATSNGALQASPWIQQFEYDQLHRIKVGSTLNGGDNYRNTYSYDPNGNITALQRYDATGNLFDDLTYNYQNTKSGQNYKENTNKLRSVDEPTSLTGLRADDIDDQNVDNYQYDETGNLIFDKSEKIANIEWTVAGKIKTITREPNSGKYDLSFTYDHLGNRVSKTATIPLVGGGYATSTTYYVRDVHDNVISNYTQTSDKPLDGIVLQEQNICGSNRLGTIKSGSKFYEIVDHLGNVRTVISETNKVENATDYYPFGMVANEMPSANKYRYGISGKEQDNEIKGNGNSIAFEARIYDTRLGRFLSMDKYTPSFPNQSPFSYATNSPIFTIDQEGNYSIISHYKWTKRALIDAGVSRKTAKEIAHYASTYADHPNKFFGLMNQIAAVFNGVNPNRIAQREGRFGSYKKTEESQKSDNVQSVSIHAMRTYFEDISTDKAVDRALNGYNGTYKDKDGKEVHIVIEGALNVIERFNGRDLEKLTTEEKKDLGVALHTIQDAVAHDGKRWVAGKKDKMEAEKMQETTPQHHHDDEDAHKNQHPNGRCVGGAGKKEAKQKTAEAINTLQGK
jgi:RHS repeat-associated protein